MDLFTFQSLVVAQRWTLEPIQVHYNNTFAYNLKLFYIHTVEKKIQNLEDLASQAIKKADGISTLEKARTQFLGRKGELSCLMKNIVDIKDKDQKKHIGSILNKTKNKLERLYQECKKKLTDIALLEELKKPIDLGLPGVITPSLGSLHPIDTVMDEIIDIFSRLGFYVRTGPCIDSDKNNFEALNIPKDHPARDMQDTFYIDKDFSLRPHTSPIQVRTMSEEEMPISVLGPGSVFRCDSDISHSPMFHQVEGLLIDKNISMADLRGTLDFFAKEFFGDVSTRFRPSFFPFTEPSAEVDCTCILCKKKGCSMCAYTGWLEIAGCGLVHPNVLRMSGIDSDKWQGFAFGLGIERMAIIKYKVEDIRLFFENDLRFLRQL